MQLIIEKIEATRNNKEGYKNVMLRRPGSYDENSTQGMDNFFLSGGDKPGRPAWQIMSDKVIEKLGVKPGEDLNVLLKKIGKPEIAIQVFETTEPEEQEEDLRLSLKPKINPSTSEVLQKNGKDIYHVTRLIPLSEFNEVGDIKIKHDTTL